MIINHDATTDRYRLDVMATETVDVISCIGGWLFDRALAGWDVTVLVATLHDDVRPLQILGVRALELESVLDGPKRCPAALSVAADLYATDGRVCNAVGEALELSTQEITVWGQRRPSELSRCAAVVHHRLSSAAGIYKRHALAAAGLQVDSVDPIETLGRAQRNSRVQLGSFCERHPGETGVNRNRNVASTSIMGRGR